jgi:hypothetical protein
MYAGAGECWQCWPDDCSTNNYGGIGNLITSALQARPVILQVLHLRTELGQLSNMAVESSHQI